MELKDNGRKLSSITLVLLTIAVLAVYVTADPTGPTSLTNEGSSTFTETGPQSTNAQAGNLSELTFEAVSPTKAWQGYYGNISGTITLEDSSGNVFYNWTANEPEGEIYASTNNTVTWSNIKCFNFTADGTSEPNVTTEEARYGIDENDVDGIDETYTGTGHDTFYVGTTQIDGCPTAYPNQDTGSQSSNFQNMLLTDTSGLVFTTIIENRDPQVDTDLTGFNGNTYDFQMFVAEDEHDQASAGPTTYYFWVEIE